MSQELTVTDLGMPTGIALRDPEVILEEAGERARALTKMVEQTKSYTQIGPSKHLRVEAWITVGQFYGCSARTTHTEEISYNGVFGFKAHARVTHDATGQILTEAEALCMQDEKNWDSKPLHQLMSMAQTRAISKALAMKFRWVVTLGGFAPTPAEEMTGLEGQEQAKPTSTQTGKQPQAPFIPYGKHKLGEDGKPKRITDPTIDLEYLDWMANKTAEQLKDPARAKFKAQDTLFLAALDAEIAHRKASAPPAEPKQPQEPAKTAPGSLGTDKLSTSMGDSLLADLVLTWEESHLAEYQATKQAFKVGSAHDLPKDQRQAFKESMDIMITTK
mgnify:CR=1 FL=1